MEKILKKYQDRLNDISRRNRAIRLSRIIKKKTFDISDLSKLDKDRPFKIANNIFIEGKSINLANINVKNSDEERDLYRQGVLENAGWSILRVWSRDWWKNEDLVVKRLDREIKKLL